MTCGIYLIKNKQDNKVYIGRSINIEKRWNSHLSALRDGTHRNNYLQHVYDKFGKDSLEHKILEECSEEELNDLEMKYIIEFSSKVPNGYNLTEGGDGNYRPSDETREKLSISKMGENNPMFGVIPSEETLKKRSSSMIGKNKGKTHSEETKEILRQYKGELASGYGRKKSQELKDKLSKERLGTDNPAFGKKRKNSTSQYYGVCFDKHNRKFRVDVRYNNQNFYLGCFENEIDAAQCYDNFIIENNFPQPLNFNR